MVEVKRRLKRIEHSTFNCVYYERKPTGTDEDEYFKQVSLGKGVHPEQNRDSVEIMLIHCLPG